MDVSQLKKKNTQISNQNQLKYIFLSTNLDIHVSNNQDQRSKVPLETVSHLIYQRPILKLWSIIST